MGESRVRQVLNTLERNHEAMGREVTPYSEAAACIRDLTELADAQQILLMCYRTGKMPAGTTLDTIRQKMESLYGIGKQAKRGR